MPLWVSASVTRVPVRSQPLLGLEGGCDKLAALTSGRSSSLEGDKPVWYHMTIIAAEEGRAGLENGRLMGVCLRGPGKVYRSAAAV